MQKMKQRVDENVQSTREVAQARGSWRVGGTQRSFLANPLLFLGEKAPFEDVSGSDREHDYVMFSPSPSLNHASLWIFKKMASMMILKCKKESTTD
jgi:hypothetical protein